VSVGLAEGDSHIGTMPQLERNLASRDSHCAAAYPRKSRLSDVHTALRSMRAAVVVPKPQGDDGEQPVCRAP
jgi:hypothetical protein